jgi:hypothetical protein
LNNWKEQNIYVGESIESLQTHNDGVMKIKKPPPVMKLVENGEMLIPDICHNAWQNSPIKINEKNQ